MVCVCGGGGGGLWIHPWIVCQGAKVCMSQARKMNMAQLGLKPKVYGLLCKHSNH